MEQFKELFSGNEQRFLTFTKLDERDDGKLVPDYRTINRPLSDKDWARHLNGEVSLGLSPLRDGKVKWGAVDVDIYPLELSEEHLSELMAKWRDPCLITLSKSGGIHIIAFADEWVDAETMRKYLTAKRDNVLSQEVIKHAQEIFPKQSDGDGSQMNLPCFGGERLVIAHQRPGLRTWVSTDHPMCWDHVGRVSSTTMADTIVAALTPKKKAGSAAPTRERKSVGGFKRPSSGKAMEGRNTYLYHVGASARARGADYEQVDEIIRMVNDEFADLDSYFGHKGPIKNERRLSALIEQVKKLPQGAILDIGYDVVEQMNQEWALLVVDGKLEFLNLSNGMTFTRADFGTYTKSLTVSLNGKRAQMSELWISDPDRAEYLGIVIEPPDYDGHGWNVFQGWAVEPKEGDASLWVDYVERLLCGGDKNLAHWVMSWIADGVQRPWSFHPGTALVLRGRQGGGKSFLGKMIARLLLPAQTQEIADSDRMFERFNRRLFGATFVLAEESVFTGSSKQASQLKVFITSNLWTYEQKHLATFDGKNVHRLIATTNDDQAVHLEGDDRRWTIVEVEPMFDDMTTEKARAAWQPYHDLDPGVVLRYLLEFEVDRDLISRPHITQAKREDKIASDPVLEVLHNIAMAGVIPDNTRGDGNIASSVLHRECRKLGASPYAKPVNQANQAKKMLGVKGSVRNAMHITDYHRTTTSDDMPLVTPVFENGGHARGFALGPLHEFRRKLAAITGAEYPEGDWARFRIVQPGDDGEPIDPNEVEHAFAEKERLHYGAESPF